MEGNRFRASEKKTLVLIPLFSLIVFALSCGAVSRTMSSGGFPTVSDAGPGPNYYVSPGGNDSNNGSQGQPWATVAHAAAVVTAGTVNVSPGIYNGQVNVLNSGTSSAHIRFVCTSYQQCTLGGESYSSAFGKATVLLQGQYVDIAYFNITDSDGTGDGGIFGYGGGTYNIIGNYVHDIPVPDCASNGGAGIDTEALGPNQGGSYIAGNWVQNIGGASGCGRASGLYLSGNGSQAVNNVVYNSWGAGISVAHDAVNTVAAFNTIDTIKRGADVGGDGIYLACDTSACDGNVVVNNILSNAQNDGLESYQGGSSDPATHNLYDNNMFFNNGANPCFFDLGTSIGCTNSVFGDPLYVNEGSNFNLQPGSPAIGSASSTDVPSTDYAGNSRTPPYDIGAFQP
jgi:hypothetical protein